MHSCVGSRNLRICSKFPDDAAGRHRPAQTKTMRMIRPEEGRLCPSGIRIRRAAALLWGGT